MTLAVDRQVERFQDVVTSKEELRAIYGEPTELVIRKQLSALDRHAQAFIARSPFALLGTASAEGRCDVSPKGDGRGFALILDEKTLVIPDRRGNRRIDSLQNIVENPRVGLLFLIPGVDETLRVNGSAVLVRDADLLERLAVDGSRPNVAIVVTVEECFFHCPKAFLRGRIWNPATFLPREELPHPRPHDPRPDAPTEPPRRRARAPDRRARGGRGGGEQVLVLTWILRKLTCTGPSASMRRVLLR